ncbi:MAG TPA: hypothetical protein VN890_06250 [Methylocella sp.]|nr:hypothetical protein [Methylocella sp.]
MLQASLNSGIEGVVIFRPAAHMLRKKKLNVTRTSMFSTRALTGDSYTIDSYAAAQAKSVS